jgi:allantoinase
MSTITSLKSRRVVLPQETRAGTILIKDGVIEDILPYDHPSPTIDFGEKVIMAGVIDPHVHFNDPGRAHWEGWKSGTLAALAGGVTTVVDMPLNCIPSTVDLPSIWAKRVSTTNQLYCDVGFWGGAVPGNSAELKTLVDAGALGLKCFLSDPGTEEFANLDRQGLEEAMRVIADIDSVLLVHAEWPGALMEPDPDLDPRSFAAWLHTRPVEAERQAIEQVVELSQKTGCRCHIVHVATPEVLDVLKGTGVTCETCAHYLVFAAEEIEDGDTRFKCAPPIREKFHQDGLWEALVRGDIQMITSDHSPCPPELKNDDFLKSWGGIAGVQMLLSAVWTGASSRGYSLQQVTKWLSAEPAKLAGFDNQGSIAPGKLANLVVFAPEAEFECRDLFHRHEGSAYQGRTWKGVVEATYLRGVQAFHDGAAGPPQGQLLNA